MSTPIRTALCLAATLFLAVPALADPTGTYAIEGVNPDGTAYDATVVVAKVGDTFTVTYTLGDGTKLSGTAIGDDDILSIGYVQDSESGVALMYRDKEEWKGVWTYIGAKTLGTEVWTAQ